MKIQFDWLKLNIDTSIAQERKRELSITFPEGIRFYVGHHATYIFSRNG